MKPNVLAAVVLACIAGAAALQWSRSVNVTAER